AVSRRFFNEILTQSRRHLSPSETLEKLLPDNPELIVEVANTLLPSPTSATDKAVRADYFKRAVPLLQNQTGERTADNWIARAWVYREMNDDLHAVSALRMAIAKEPKYESLRLELAKILFHMGDRAQARRELDAFLNREP